jgi:cytoskeletal protein CcmA (bactofilin family)
MKFRRASDRTIEVTRLSSLVDAGVEIVGDVLITDGLRVDGRIRGDVRGKPDTKGLLVLSQHGSIEGNVRVHDAVINGTVTGDLEVDHYLELQSAARITGNIRYRQLKMDCGAAVDGRLDRLGEQSAAVVGGDNVVSLTRAHAGD